VGWESSAHAIFPVRCAQVLGKQGGGVKCSTQAVRSSDVLLLSNLLLLCPISAGFLLSLVPQMLMALTNESPGVTPCQALASPGAKER